MTPYAQGGMPSGAIHDLEYCVAWMAALPDPDDPRRCLVRDGRALWTCHGLVRAFVRLRLCMGWEVSTGYFGPHHRHSWLWCRLGEPPRRQALILDVYPVAGIRPMLVDATPPSPWDALYRDAPRWFGPDDVSGWLTEAGYALELTNNLEIAT